MKDRTVMEFYVQTHLVAYLETDAPPPEAEAEINIKSRDYRVVRTDYSVDQPTGGPKTFRRNVYMWPKDTLAGEPFSVSR